MWTEKEIEDLIFYYVKGLSLVEIHSKIPTHSQDAIRCKAYNLGLRTKLANDLCCHGLTYGEIDKVSRLKAKGKLNKIFELFDD